MGVGKLTGANITDLKYCHCHDPPSQRPCQLKSDCERRNGIRQKKQSPVIYKKQWAQHPAPFSQICSAFFHLLMLTSVRSAGVERANSALNLVERANSALTLEKTVKLSSVHQDRVNPLVLLRVHTDIKLDIQLLTSAAGSIQKECFSLIL